MRTVPACLALLAGVALAPPAAVAEDAKPAPPPKGLSIGDVAPPLEAKDLDGKTFALASARTVSAADALAAVNEAAKAFEATGTLAAADPLDKVPGLVADGKVDGAKRARFATLAGRAWGLVATADSSAEWKTVGDVVTWIEGAAEAPIVFVCWSPGCPTSKAYETRLFATVAKHRARVYPLACNATDEEDRIRSYAADMDVPVRVLLDRDQKVSDVLGGRRTPHVFVLDAKNALRYAGSIDSDAMESEPEERRIRYLDLALTALREGGAVSILLTTPVG